MALRSLKVLCLFATIVAATAVPAGGNTVWVDDDCTPPGTGTELDPFCSIEDAWNDAGTLAGDTIRVRAGTYSECPEQPQVPADKPVDLVADEWLLNPTDPTTAADVPTAVIVQELTVIDGLGACDIVGVEEPTVILGGGSSLRGFTITNGGDSGVFVFGGSATIEANEIFFNDSLTGGGGLFILTGNCDFGPTVTTIRNNWIHDNDSLEDGGGIYLEAGPDIGPPVCAVPGGATVVIEGNVIEDHALPEGNGAGMWIGTRTFIASTTVSVTVQDNVIRDNTATSVTPAFDFGVGGGLQITQAFADGSGIGTETVVVRDNLFQTNTATDLGGGIATETIVTNPGTLRISITNNRIIDNSAEGGGGMDLFLSASQVPPSSTTRVEVVANDVLSNVSGGGGGGGISAVMEVFLSSLAGTNSTIAISDNKIVGNTDDGAGGGAFLYSRAREILGVPTPATSSIEFHGNLVAANTSSGYGLGIELLLLACQNSTATATIDNNTIANNTAVGPGVTGLDILPVTPSDSAFASNCPSLVDSGLSDVTVGGNIVANNGAIGIGGLSDPNLTVTVGDTDNFGHSANYESLLASSLVQEPTNISVDPQFAGGPDPLDPASYAPDVCSPVFDLGTDGAGFWRSPDVTGDDEVDGIDVLDLAVSFGAQTGDARFDASADLDRDGLVGPDDLTPMAGDFAEVCN